MKNSKEKFEEMHELHIPEGTEYIDEQFCDQIELDTDIEKIYISPTTYEIDYDYVTSTFENLRRFIVDEETHISKT